MIEVRIRHIDEALGTPIGKFAPSEINDLPQLVKQYGCYANGDMSEFVSAQFVADNTLTVEVFFEIIVEHSDGDIS